MPEKYHKKSYEERKAEVDELSKTLMSGIQNIIASGEIQNTLDNINRFQYNYSTNNWLLILMQNSEATFVGPVSSFNKINRQVEPGQKGMKIYQPIQIKYKTLEDVKDENGNIVLDESGNPKQEEKLVKAKSYKVGYVFDISQTKQIEGKPVVEMEVVKPLVSDVKNYQLMIDAVKSISPVPISFAEIKGGANGYYDRVNEKIVIKEGMSQAQTLKTMCHEIAHSILHAERKEFEQGVTFGIYDLNIRDTAPTMFGLSLEDAIKVYEDMKHDAKRLEIKLLDDTTVQLMEGNKIITSSLNRDEEARENLNVAKAVNSLMEKFPADGGEIRSNREIQAESVAYCVMHAMGVDSSDYSLRYVSAWADLRPEMVLENLNIIRPCALHMIEDLEKNIPELELQYQKDPEIDNLMDYLKHELSYHNAKVVSYEHEVGTPYSVCTLTIANDETTIRIPVPESTTQGVLRGIYEWSEQNPASPEAIELSQIVDRIVYAAEMDGIEL